MTSTAECTPVSDEERRARMVMSRVAEPGDTDACRLVADHGAAALLERLTAFRPTSDETSKLGGWADRLSATDADHLQREGERLECRYLCPGDEEWPDQTADLVRVPGRGPDRRGGSPFGLWVRGAGHLSDQSGNSVAIVGARSATAYGEHVASEIALGCSVDGWTVVSGGAYGIDAAAHRGALAAERSTLCVLAGGIDRLYPAGHAPMLRRILERGCLISEAAPGCAPTKSRFLVRNRLIAALTRGTVVVEAALRSGSLNTARWAQDVGRVVMGVPGPVTSAASRGVHELLRSELAVLVTAADEVIELVSPIGAGLAIRREAPHEAVDVLAPEVRRVLDAMPRHQAASVASVALTAGLARGLVTTHLTFLQARGWIEQPTPGLWRLVGRR